ncbi:uncharacterized protein [Periplaneta americana]|uniref:uncharacterized protein isoform X3 n=1 Tax=Periplaneta americana TaxID=6978 RepID=UPI0037E76845
MLTVFQMKMEGIKEEYGMEGEIPRVKEEKLIEIKQEPVPFCAVTDTNKKYMCQTKLEHDAEGQIDPLQVCTTFSEDTSENGTIVKHEEEDSIYDTQSSEDGSNLTFQEDDEEGFSFYKELSFGKTKNRLLQYAHCRKNTMKK